MLDPVNRLHVDALGDREITTEIVLRLTREAFHFILTRKRLGRGCGLEFRLALIGFGNVGQGLARILRDKGRIIRERYGLDCKIVAISDPIKGSVYDEGGLDPATLLALVEKDGHVNNYPGGVKGLDSLETIRGTDSNVVVEVTPTNVETGEPGLTHIRTALEVGKHVVTSNKGPIALAYRELMALAEKKGVILRFEGTVLSGTPAISLATEALAGADVLEVKGIVNGTTNFILTKMENGLSYEDALREAQRLGYAEADPTADVEGWDAAVKLVILANVVMGADITLRDVEREGITGVTREDVEVALRDGQRIKLIASARREGSRVIARVAPTGVPLTHPLANVMGAMNALTLVTDHLGEVTVVGPGAGRVETGQAILSDLLAIHRLLR